MNNEINVNRYFYIYNIKQAQFFLQNGLMPVDVGMGVEKDVFIKFVRDEQAENVFNQWVNRK